MRCRNGWPAWRWRLPPLHQPRCLSGFCHHQRLPLHRRRPRYPSRRRAL